jgi:hypothetical protein
MSFFRKIVVRRFVNSNEALFKNILSKKRILKRWKDGLETIERQKPQKDLGPY